MHAACCTAECVLAPLLPVDADTLPDWTLVVLYLAEQYYYLDRGLPLPKPTWAPYLQSLPKYPVGTVLDWPVEEVGTAVAVLLSTGLAVEEGGRVGAPMTMSRQLWCGLVAWHTP
jgi:hypothetical protein